MYWALQVELHFISSCEEAGDAKEGSKPDQADDADGRKSKKRGIDTDNYNPAQEQQMDMPGESKQDTQTAEQATAEHEEGTASEEAKQAVATINQTEKCVENDQAPCDTAATLQEQESKEADKDSPLQEPEPTKAAVAGISGQEKKG